MRDYIKPLLRKEPDRVILHIGTNNATNETSREIVDEMLSLKTYVEKLNTGCKVILSSLINQLDDGKG